MKHKADSVCARRHCRKRIVKTGDATDFDTNTGTSLSGQGALSEKVLTENECSKGKRQRQVKLHQTLPFVRGLSCLARLYPAKLTLAGADTLSDNHTRQKQTQKYQQHIREIGVSQ